MYEKINFINGNVISLDPENSEEIDVISTVHGKIYSLNQPIKKAKDIDLNGATIIPGFVDSHFHLKNMGKRLNMINLKSCKSISEILVKTKDVINRHADDEWIFGFGWDQTLWDVKDYPTKNILNNISPKNPIVFTRIDGHCIWVNECAIKKSTYDLSNLIAPYGGEIINDCIFVDNAMSKINQIIPKENLTKTKSWIKLAINEIVKRGITNVHDAWQDKLIIKSIKKLEMENNLPIRCYGMLSSNDKELIDLYFKKGYYESSNYTIRSVKAFIDGALGSRGASLLEPYSDCSNHCGLILISKDDFDELAYQCNKYDFQLCTHAIGDNGNRLVLDAYINNTKHNPNHRWRVEHAQMVEHSDINKFINGRIIPSMQPSHCTSDMRWLDSRIGKNRLGRISKWKTFVDANVPIAGGSDCPIEDGEPLYEYYAAITRQDHNGLPKGGWQPQERLDRISALKMFTVWAAYSEFAEHKRGMIKIGYDADMTIFSDDITKCPVDDILKTEAIGTIVGGKVVYLNL